MSTTLESLGIDRLPLEEKIALAHDLWESIAADAEHLPLKKNRSECSIAGLRNWTLIPQWP
jgi:hypothetical protein